MGETWSEKRRRERAMLQEALERLPEAEREFRQALAELRNVGLTLDDLRREIHVTPFEGAYGPAGVVLAINGSPPAALALATVDKDRRGATVVVFRSPGSATHPTVMDSFTHMRYKSGKRLRAYNATLAYLTSLGFFDDSGHRVLEVEPYVSEIVV